MASKVGPVSYHLLADLALEKFGPTVDNVRMLACTLGAGQQTFAEITTDSAVGHNCQVGIATI